MMGAAMTFLFYSSPRAKSRLLSLRCLSGLRSDGIYTIIGLVFYLSEAMYGVLSATPARSSYFGRIVVLRVANHKQDSRRRRRIEPTTDRHFPCIGLPWYICATVCLKRHLYRCLQQTYIRTFPPAQSLP